MEGVELAARFALAPNSLSYCGTPAFRGAFSDFLDLKTAAAAGALESSLKKFTAHYAYLCLIAEASGKSPFDREVAEAFWLGNGLLWEVKKKELASLISDEFCGTGMLSYERAMKLADELPDGFLPHHSFHVLYLHTISGAIEPSLRNADLCRGSWGRVIGVDGNRVAVKSQKLIRVNGKLALVEQKRKWKASCAGIRLLEGARRGDFVASHWGFAVMKLSQAQAARLEKFTLQNLKAANRL